MNSVGILRLNQLRKLFLMFKGSLMKSLNNFGPREGTGFEFTILN
jgi:hypothetical protein